LDHQKFKSLVASVSVGKKLPEAIYIHKDAFQNLDEELIKFINVISKALKVDNNSWNIVKLSKKDFKLSLLNYPSFFTDSYPSLDQSITIDLVKLTQRIAKYSDYDNPPILHRKETMLSDSHPYHEEFKLITQEGEAAGLYQNSRMIGFKSSWERLIAKHGYELIDGRLFRNSALIKSNSDDKKIDRHKTAITRHELSSPMKSLAKHEFLSGEYSVFDYGCGQGDDLSELEAHGIDAIGWDPNFRPDTEKVASDIVNIGFVINVIEDVDERIEALLGAWEITAKLLVVSAMIANDSHIEKFTPYKDGVLTSRNTFQKYFSQTELKEYIEKILEENSITISPGIFYIFRDKILEQTFLQNRNKRHYQWQQRTAKVQYSEEYNRLLFTKHAELFQLFWLDCLAHGRCPANDEFSRSEEISKIIGSNKKAFRLVCEWFDITEFETSAKMRREDLILYFTLELFGKRKAYTQQSEDLKRDIKVFFDNYKTAQNEAKSLLFEIADKKRITEECLFAKEYLPAAKMYHEGKQPHSLTIHKKFLDLLSPLLRVYVQAGLQLYGELDDIQLIKIHMNSGKLTLLGYTGFDDGPLPQLTERVKIKMAEQDVDFFDYMAPEKQPLLLDKIEYIDESFEDYKKQKAFNSRLTKILSNTGAVIENLTHISLAEYLFSNKVKVRGYRFYNY